MKNYAHIERILVPVPLNREMIIPIRQAIYFHDKYESEIVILHVVNEIPLLKKWLSARTLIKHKKKGKAKLKKLLRRFFKDHPILDHIEIKVVTGRLIPSILRVAANRKADLVIIKKVKRAHGKARPFRKENADKLVSDSSCPVMTVFYEPNLKGINSILLPVDITKKTDKKVELAISMAKKFDASIHVVSVQHLEIARVHSLSYNKGRKIEQAIKNEGIEAELILLKAGKIPAEDVVLNYAEKLKPDLMLIMTHQETTLFDNYLGVFAREIIHKSKVPVLSVMPQRKSLGEDFIESLKRQQYASF